MCQFFSCILTQNDVLYIEGVNNHEKIIEKYNLDDTTSKPDFVRLEFLPDSKISKDKTKWTLKVDQDYLPEWYSKKDAKHCLIALDKEIEKRILRKGKNSVKEGFYLACGSAEVEAYDSAEVLACGSAKVLAYGSAKVRAYGSAEVEAWDSAKVLAYGSAKVEAWDSAEVVKI